MGKHYFLSPIVTSLGSDFGDGLQGPWRT